MAVGAALGIGAHQFWYLIGADEDGCEASRDELGSAGQADQRHPSSELRYCVP